MINIITGPEFRISTNRVWFQVPMRGAASGPFIFLRKWRRRDACQSWSS